MADMREFWVPGEGIIGEGMEGKYHACIATMFTGEGATGAILSHHEGREFAVLDVNRHGMVKLRDKGSDIEAMRTAFRNRVSELLQGDFDT